MRSVRPAFAVGAVAALFVGGVALATSRNSSHSSIPVKPVAQQIVVQPSPSPVVRQRSVEQPTPRVVRRTHVVTTTRSGKKSALIIGGSAAGGAITGALIGGKKGAVIGGLIGGAGGTAIRAIPPFTNDAEEATCCGWPGRRRGRPRRR